IPAGNKESVTLVLEDDQQGNTITLEITGLEDDTLYENKMEDYSTEIEVADSTFDGLNRVEYSFDADSDDSILYVVYSEEVNDTAIDIDNYLVRVVDGEGYDYE
ncbi:hypothetical protein, partial [Chengkuizengella axinellae]